MIAHPITKKGRGFGLLDEALEGGQRHRRCGKLSNLVSGEFEKFEVGHADVNEFDKRCDYISSFSVGKNADMNAFPLQLFLSLSII